MQRNTYMATKTVAKDEIKTAFIERFRTSSIHTDGIGATHREKAMQALDHLEIPTRKWEEWKYTQLSALVKDSYQKGQSFDWNSIDTFLIPNLKADVLVFLNGIFAPHLSNITFLKDQLVIKPLEEIDEEVGRSFETYFGKVISAESNIFSALNAAYLERGVFIHLPKNVVAEHPIHILHLTHPDSQATGIQHRNIFVTETGSNVKIIETFHTLSEGNSFRNAVTEIYQHPNSRLEYVKVQQESNDASQIDQTAIYQLADTYSAIYTLSFSGKIIRNNLHIGLHGPNAEAHLMGIYMLDGIQHVDNHTQVDHAVPNCYSNELYKGIMHEQSTGVFNGRIHVYPDAQKTNAFQSNRNILLSDNANIFTKPQLEIYADDVKCSHGATTGRLDKDAMFYLRARGLNEETAKKLLIQAFAAEVVEHISIEPITEHLVSMIENRF